MYLIEKEKENKEIFEKELTMTEEEKRFNNQFF